MKSIANFISYLFHPIFIVSYMFLVIYCVNPYLFRLNNLIEVNIHFISIFLFSVFFPLLGVFLMKGIGLIDSIHLKDQKQRIGPLIITGVFYIWLFLNIKSNPNIPIVFSSFVLGSTIGLFLAFFMNNFSKVSLHGVAMGGLLTIMLIFRFAFAYEKFSVDFPGLGVLTINSNLIVIITVLIVGMVCSSRMILQKHNLLDIKNGFLLGVVSQLIAARIIL